MPARTVEVMLCPTPARKNRDREWAVEWRRSWSVTSVFRGRACSLAVRVETALGGSPAKPTTGRHGRLERR